MEIGVAQVAAKTCPSVLSTTWRVNLTLPKTFALCFLPFSKMCKTTQQPLGSKTCPNMAELHTFLDIFTPQTRLARPLSLDGCCTIKKYLEIRSGH